MTTNSTDTPLACNASTIDGFLDQALADSLDVAHTLTICPSICNLAWGVGSPDIYGIGVRETATSSWTH